MPNLWDRIKAGISELWDRMKARMNQLWDNILLPPTRLGELAERDHRNVVGVMLVFLAIAFSLIFSEALKAVIHLRFSDGTFFLFGAFDTGIYLSSTIRELLTIGNMVFFFGLHAYIFSNLINVMVKLDISSFCQVGRFVYRCGFQLLFLIWLHLWTVVIPVALLWRAQDNGRVPQDVLMFKDLSGYVHFLAADFTLIVTFFILIFNLKFRVRHPQRCE